LNGRIELNAQNAETKLGDALRDIVHDLLLWMAWHVGGCYRSSGMKRTRQEGLEVARVANVRRRSRVRELGDAKIHVAAGSSSGGRSALPPTTDAGSVRALIAGDGLW
jgi:hypothetical protein